jgi:hypothetical protein
VAAIGVEEWLGPTEDKITPPRCSADCTKKDEITFKGDDYLRCICGDGKIEYTLLE